MCAKCVRVAAEMPNLCLSCSLLFSLSQEVLLPLLPVLELCQLAAVCGQSPVVLWDQTPGSGGVWDMVSVECSE